MFKKCIILATAIVAVLVLVSCKDKKKTDGQTAETTAMPSHGDGAGQTANNEIAQEKSDVIETAVVEAQNEAIVFPAERIDFGELVEKDGVYYLNNVPFTGVANRWDYGETIWTMKDGILHGPYSSDMDGCTTDGNYKNGKKDGKWKSSCDGEETIEIWKDDVLISEQRRKL